MPGQIQWITMCAYFDKVFFFLLFLEIKNNHYYSSVSLNVCNDKCFSKVLILNTQTTNYGWSLFWTTLIPVGVFYNKKNIKVCIIWNIVMWNNSFQFLGLIEASVPKKVSFILIAWINLMSDLSSYYTKQIWIFLFFLLKSNWHSCLLCNKFLYVNIFKK